MIPDMLAVVCVVVRLLGVLEEIFFELRVDEGIKSKAIVEIVDWIILSWKNVEGKMPIYINIELWLQDSRR